MLKPKSKTLARFRKLRRFLYIGEAFEMFGDDCQYRLPAHFDHCGYLEEKENRGYWCGKSICPYLKKELE